MTDSALECHSVADQAGHTAAAAPAAPTDIPLAAGDDFAMVLRRVQDAAREWGIRPDLMEGKFVSALMAAVEWSGRVSQSAQVEFRTLHNSTAIWPNWSWLVRGRSQKPQMRRSARPGAR